MGETEVNPAFAEQFHFLVDRPGGCDRQTFIPLDELVGRKDFGYPPDYRLWQISVQADIQGSPPAHTRIFTPWSGSWVATSRAEPWLLTSVQTVFPRSVSVSSHRAILELRQWVMGPAGFL